MARCIRVTLGANCKMKRAEHLQLRLHLVYCLVFGRHECRGVDAVQAQLLNGVQPLGHLACRTEGANGPSLSELVKQCVQGLFLRGSAVEAVALQQRIQLSQAFV